jgi:hypothetical protein
MVHGKYNRYDSPEKERNRDFFGRKYFEHTALSKTIINVDHSSSPTAHLTSLVFTPPPPVLTVSAT